MIKINGQNISLTRGDYAPLVFSAYEDDSLFDLSAGDKVVLQIGKKYGTPLITKEKVKGEGATTTDDYTIEILPEDTKNLKNGGVYFYDVAIVDSQGNVCTYIGADEENKPTLHILNEVGGENE